MTVVLRPSAPLIEAGSGIEPLCAVLQISAPRCSITCEILIDSKIVKSTTSTGFASICTTSSTL